MAMTLMMMVPQTRGRFPPRVDDWKDVDYGKRPLVTVDRARRGRDVMNKFISEHIHHRKQRSLS